MSVRNCVKEPVNPGGGRLSGRALGLGGTCPEEALVRLSGEALSRSTCLGDVCPDTDRDAMAETLFNAPWTVTAVIG